MVDFWSDLREDRQLRQELLHLSRVGSVGRMARVLAHELTEPLTAIAFYLSAVQRLLCSDAPLDHAAVQAANRASQQVQRAIELTRLLRALAPQNEEGRKYTSVSAAIADASDLAQIVARRAGVRIELQLNSDALVLGDPTQIQQVIFILMREALEGMSESECGVLRVSTMRSGTHIIVCIGGSGCGLSLNDALQAKASFASSREAYIGLDLLICREFILGQSGDLWMVADASLSAILCFALPVTRSV